MKKFFRLIAAMLAVCLCILPVSAAADREGTCKPYPAASYVLTYEELQDGTLCITGYEGEPKGRLVLPETIHGKTVTRIGDNAFGGGAFFRGDLILPATVTEIGGRAFDSCRCLDGRLSLPEGLRTIGYGAFAHCWELSGSLVIPDTVTEIGGSAFTSCGKFQSLKLGKGLTAISEEAFSGMKRLTGSLTIPEGVTSIGKSAFVGAEKLRGSLVLPKTLKTIDEYAFSGCGFTGTLEIPDSVTRLGASAFSGCKGLTGVKIGSGIKAIQKNTFWNCTGLTWPVDIPEQVTEIGEGAFYGCTGFTGPLELPETITAIGENAFYGCTGFTGPLKISKKITSIGKSAFANCGITEFIVAADNPVCSSRNGLLLSKDGKTLFTCPAGKTGTLEIPAGVTAISDYAAAGCEKLTGSLTIPAGVVSIGKEAFSGCRGLNGSLTLPDSLKTLGAGAFRNCENLTGSLKLPNQLQKIEELTFFGCKNMKGTLTLPANLQEIGQSAFHHCGFNGSLTLPDSLKTMGRYAFYQCSGFSGDLTLPKNLKDIPMNAFYECSGFDGKLTFSAGTETVDFEAFLGCRFKELCVSQGNPKYVAENQMLLEKKDGAWGIALCPQGKTGPLVIPEKVTFIGPEAFEGCTGLTGDLILPENIESIDYNAFKGCTGFCGRLGLPAGLRWLGEEAFSGCTGLTGELVLPDSLPMIQCFTFLGCTGFTGNLALPENLVSVACGAFQDCSEIRGELKIPASLLSITDGAFQGCNFSGITVSPDNQEFSIRNGLLFHDTTKEVVLCPAGKNGPLTLPEDTERICGGAFMNRTELTGNLVLPEGLLSISSQAFEGCTGLTGNLVIPQAVQDVVFKAFAGCNFDSITVDYGNHYFSSRDGLLLSREKDLLNACPCGKTGTAIVPASVEWVDPECFAGCSRLQSIVFLGKEAPDFGDDCMKGITVTAFCDPGWPEEKLQNYGGNITWKKLCAGDHELVHHEGKLPTCTEPGWKPYDTCKNCAYTTYEGLPALGTACDASEKFADVGGEQWYNPYADFVLSRKLFGGTGETTFEPDTPMTRAMLVTVLWRCEGKPETGVNYFTDVPEDQWYTEAVVWAASQGVVNGVTETEFAPDEVVTREQMAAILYRYAKTAGLDVTAKADLSSFPDAEKVSDFAQTPVAWAAAEKLLRGSEGKLLPQGSATRAQVAAVLTRFVMNGDL